MERRGLTGRKGLEVRQVVSGLERLKAPAGHLGQKIPAGQAMSKGLPGIRAYEVRTVLKGRDGRTDPPDPRDLPDPRDRGDLTGRMELTGCGALTGRAAPRDHWEPAGQAYTRLEVLPGLLPIMRARRAG